MFSQKTKKKNVPDILRRIEFWLPCLLVLHFLIVLHAAQWYMYAVFAGYAPRPWLYLRWSMTLWYSRVALAPIAIWVALRYRFELDRWFRYLVIYSGSALAIALFGSALQSRVVIRLETQRFFYPSSSIAPGEVHLTGFQKAVIKGWPHLVYNMFTCWMLIGLVQGACYYRDARQKELEASQLQTQLATLRLQALRMQLNPHFLFNTLHAISTLIEEEPKAAEEMILRLSHLLRSILDEGTAEISLSKELGFLECHLGIEQVRFGNRLTTKMEIDDALLDCAVPSLILQPLIENVIQHGIGRHAGSDSIEITVSQHSDFLHIEVRNSNSRLAQSADDSKKMGIGLSNTELRLKALYKERSSLQLHNLIPSGVAVSITLPFRKVTEKERILENEDAFLESENE